MNTPEELLKAVEKIATYRGNLVAFKDVESEIAQMVDTFQAIAVDAASDEESFKTGQAAAIGQLLALRKFLEQKANRTAETEDPVEAIGELMNALSEVSILNLRRALKKMVGDLPREEQSALFKKATGFEDISHALKHGKTLDWILEQVKTTIAAAQEQHEPPSEILEPELVDAPPAMPTKPSATAKASNAIAKPQRFSRTPVNALHNASIDELLRIAEILHKSGLFATRFKSSEQVFAALLFGMAYGIEPMIGLTSINVINGNPAMSAQLMLGLVQGSGELADLKIVSKADVCEVTVRRRGYESPIVVTFTLEDAKRMGLLDKKNWQQQPAVMLRWRAIVAALRIAFADVLTGLYTPEELGDESPVEE